MITLKTGVPGSGKTLSAVHELMQAIQKSPERCVFVHGVKNLACPHRKLPVNCVQGGQKIERREVIDAATGERDMVPVVVEEEDPGSIYECDWSQVPDGSLVIVDEAQRVFPMRGAGQRVPPHVAFLNTHRHRGIDIWVITQHPKLIDNAVRRLVGKHQHYRRVFGGQRAICYEWDSCSDGLQYGGATKGLFQYPKKAFTYYHSAEVHTKQKFSWPLWLAVPLLAIPLGVLAIPKAVAVLHGSATGMGIQPASLSASAPMAGASAARPPIAPASAAQVAQAASEPVRPKYLGCMATHSRCQCVTSDGVIEEGNLLCQASAQKFGYLVALDVSHHEPPKSVEKPASHEEGPVSISLGGDPMAHAKFHHRN